MGLLEERIAALEVDILGLRKGIKKDKITVNHISENQRYRIVIERAASSTKEVEGFKIEANGDDIEDIQIKAKELYSIAQSITEGEKINLRVGWENSPHPT